MARWTILCPPRSWPLDGIWEIASLAPGLALDPNGLDAVQPDWMSCPGPMPAAAALRACGRWDLQHPRDFDAEDWWYRCRFKVDFTEAVRLRFEGLATVADVWLNGQHILHAESMFVAHTVKVPDGLRGENVLILRFHALTPLLRPRRPHPKWRARLVSHQGLRWYRTSLLGRMPAWCPPVAPVGPWRPILVEMDSLRIEHADLKAGLDGDTGYVRASLLAVLPSATTVHGTISVGDWDSPLTCEPSADGRIRLAAVVRVPRPDRWWPHTHGAQPLYSVRATCVAEGVTETVDLGRVGFRTISVDRGADGRGFGLDVNGAPVFCRGVCWTPLDLASLSATPSAYRAALGQLREAGMNMVRIGGTMTYETDTFHDLCDELGILVWQDFMFANMDYPWDDARFARTATQEVTQTLEALQSRPSLAVLCGGSELEQQRAMLGLSPELGSTRLLEQSLTDLVQAGAPGTIWVPTTPSGGTFPFQIDSGVSHYYGVGAYRRPFEDARRARVRFAAECLALSNVPDSSGSDIVSPPGGAAAHHPLWKLHVPRDAGADWDFEDIRDHYVERLFAIDPADVRSRDPERYLALGRVASGETMLRTFAEWRRPGSTCRGGLVWLARDLWPGAGWGIIASDGRPKAAYWYLRRALAPVALFAADEGLNGLQIHAVNDTAAPIEGDLRIALYHHGALRGVPASARLRLAARGHHTVHADALFEGFRDLTYAYRFGPPAHDVIAATLRDAGTDVLRAATYYFPGALPADPDRSVGLTVRTESTDDGYALVIGAERFAHAVAIDVEGFLPDDNYLHLEPGETRRIGLRATHGAVPGGCVSALNSRDVVPIVAAEALHAS
jgi:beta-mannosidase